MKTAWRCRVTFSAGVSSQRAALLNASGGTFIDEMKFLFLVLIVAVAFVLSAWLLPWWATLALVVVIIAPLAWVAWKIVSAIKRDVVPALKKVAEGMPRAQERMASVPAGERFRGNGFAFTFPVPCDVSQTVIDDLEVMLLKPKLNGSTNVPKGVMVVSTIPREELKTKINAQLDAVFAQVRTAIARQACEGTELQTESFISAEVGPFRGECRKFEASNEGKKLRGETVYLGDERFSVGWALMGPADTFDAGAERYRELAGLIERVTEPTVIDVATGQKN
jgi:hypothetical protein